MPAPDGQPQPPPPAWPTSTNLGARRPSDGPTARPATDISPLNSACGGDLNLRLSLAGRFFLPFPRHFREVSPLPAGQGLFRGLSGRRAAV
ncbi:MAG: hypothetical protein KGM43_04275, partial [Planctomycetota bacterium]|nr:hypothetical protein [Planctomycetota bacterium]